MLLMFEMGELCIVVSFPVAYPRSMSEPAFKYAERFRGFLPVVVDIETAGLDVDDNRQETAEAFGVSWRWGRHCRRGYATGADATTGRVLRSNRYFATLWDP